MRADRQRQYRAIQRHKSKTDDLSLYDLHAQKKYIPEPWARDWIKDMRALVPRLIQSL